MVKPGNPPYLEYVRSTVEQKRQSFQKNTGSSSGTRSDWDKYRHDLSDEKKAGGPEAYGNPNLIYVSKFVEGWEPSGVPVCLCIFKPQDMIVESY